MTLESTKVTGGWVAGTARRRGSFATQQVQQLVGAHRGGCPATHPVHKPLPASAAGLGADNAQCFSVLDDIYLIALVQAVPFAEGSGDGYLALAVKPHSNLLIRITSDTYYNTSC
jgi:hypothetical protein